MQRSTNGTHFACAACKNQRKKCNETCILAPILPANKSREFHAVHKVFGVSNITKLVKIAKEEDRRRVLESLIWEAMCRQKDPILGPYGEYIKIYDEYKKVVNELMIYKNQNLQLQLPYQGGCGSVGPQCVQDFIAWKGTKGEHKGEIVDNALDYVHDNNNCVIDSTNIYTYHSNYLQDFENMRPEAVVPFQQHSRPYYNITGQFSQMNN